MTNRLTLIAALSISTRVIEKDGKVPWELPVDMKRFVKRTTGHPVIMGRKTWESIDPRYRPLKNRTNIIVTRQKGYVAEGAHVVSSPAEARALAFSSPGAEEVFCIGGGELYKELFDFADCLDLTIVLDGIKDGITFPAYHEFTRVVAHGPFFESTETTPAFFFLTLER